MGTHGVFDIRKTSSSDSVDLVNHHCREKDIILFICLSVSGTIWQDAKEKYLFFIENEEQKFQLKYTDVKPYG